MTILTVQLNHPGAEKPFKLGRGYSQHEGRLIREWYGDKKHYRKFLLHQGFYLTKIGATPKYDDILFWGEWEGNSYFQPLNKLNNLSPNGIHQPFHSLHIRNHQNTDPYIYGENFLYCICKQRGRLTQLEKRSVILFGSSFKNGFSLDTVFVVGSYESVHDVSSNKAFNYSKKYSEVTLEQLQEDYFDPKPNSKLRLYNGLTFANNPEFFSYTPCKKYDDVTKKGFTRVILPYEKINGVMFSNNPTGIKILDSGHVESYTIWQSITQEVLRQGFALGFKINEPE